jgi:hypothetical protein
VATSLFHHNNFRLLSTPSRSQIRLSTDEKSITVSPADSLAGNPKNTTWLPASSLNIQQEILGTNQDHQATAGTAFTRIIRMRAESLSAEQLPPPDMQAKGIKVYSETPVLNNKDNQNGVIGLREDRAAIIAEQSGKLLLPAITIPWYDVDAAQWREAVLPATEIDVLPGTTTDTTVTNTTTPTDNTPVQDKTTVTQTNQLPVSTEKSYLWQISTSVLFILLLAVIIYLYRQQLRSKPSASDNTATPSTLGKPLRKAALQHVTAQGDLKKLHHEIQVWAKEQESNNAVLQHPSIAPLLQSLEKHLYGNGSAPDAQALKNLPTQLEALATNLQKPDGQATQLVTLYR